jgi:hypothetical protein
VRRCDARLVSSPPSALVQCHNVTLHHQLASRVVASQSCAAEEHVCAEFCMSDVHIPTPHHNTHTHTRRPPPCNTFDLSRLGLRVSTFCVVCCCVRSRIRLADIFLKALALSPCLTFNQHSDSTHSQRTFLKSVLTCVQEGSSEAEHRSARCETTSSMGSGPCAPSLCSTRLSTENQLAHTLCVFFSFFSLSVLFGAF